MQSELEKRSIGRVAQKIALRCVRNTSIENIHAGRAVRSKAGDYSDVTVVTPYGEIPWTDVSRISQDEMKTFNKEVVNKIFTVLIMLGRGCEMKEGPNAFYAPHNWDMPEIDPDIERLFTGSDVRE